MPKKKTATKKRTPKKRNVIRSTGTVLSVTDRAYRYRANRNPPPPPKLCNFCGSRRNVEIGHINGHEEDSAAQNLIWTCRSCNVRCGRTMANAGLGRKTRQYNPAGDGDGAQTLAQWVTAVTSMKGENDAMSVADAVALIRATPPDRRSSFARQIWSTRRKRGTDTTAVPF